MAKFNVGDTVIRRHRRGSSEETITRVGRKYVYIEEFHRELPFDIETGVERTNYGAPDCIYTLAEWSDLQHRAGLESRLKDLGVKFDYGSRRLSTATLEKILAAVQEEVSGE